MVVLEHSGRSMGVLSHSPQGLPSSSVRAPHALPRNIWEVKFLSSRLSDVFSKHIGTLERFTGTCKDTSRQSHVIQSQELLSLILQCFPNSSTQYWKRTESGHELSTLKAMLKKKLHHIGVTPAFSSGANLRPCWAVSRIFGTLEPYPSGFLNHKALAPFSDWNHVSVCETNDLLHVLTKHPRKP